MLITKLIALIVSESMPWDSENFVKPKIKEDQISIKVTKTQSRSKKNMNDSLKANFSFIGLPLSVTEVCH